MLHHKMKHAARSADDVAENRYRALTSIIIPASP
jgi:hypothetical protein